MSANNAKTAEADEQDGGMMKLLSMLHEGTPPACGLSWQVLILSMSLVVYLAGDETVREHAIQMISKCGVDERRQYLTRTCELLEGDPAGREAVVRLLASYSDAEVQNSLHLLALMRCFEVLLDSKTWH